jgi:hypothetical protein
LPYRKYQHARPHTSPLNVHKLLDAALYVAAATGLLLACYAALVALLVVAS